MNYFDANKRQQFGLNVNSTLRNRLAILNNLNMTII